MIWCISSPDGSIVPFMNMVKIKARTTASQTPILRASVVGNCDATAASGESASMKITRYAHAMRKMCNMLYDNIALKAVKGV